MRTSHILLYIGVMALVTYGIRMMPFTLMRSKIKSKYINSFDQMLVHKLPLYNNIYEDYITKKHSCYKLYEENTE